MITSNLFKGRHFDQDIIVLCVRWYLRFKLSSRDLVQMMAERGVTLTHTTILRWVQRYVPEFEKRWNKYSRPVGRSWRCDETYIKVKGQWTYLYRAVDRQGWTVDFLLSERRNVAAAKRFFSKATKKHGTPRVIYTRCLRGFASSHRGAEISGNGCAQCWDTIQQVFEQYCGAGSSSNQTTDSTDARVQAIRDSDDNYQWHRACKENSETAVQHWKLAGQTCNCS
jgi:transposase-like protein